MFTFDLPDTINGSQLAEAITALGFTGVDVVILDAEDDRPGRVDVTVAGLDDPMPPAEDREACADGDELDELIATYTADWQKRNRETERKIAAVVAKHIAVEVPPPTPLERMAAGVGLTRDELADAIKEAVGG